MEFQVKLRKRRRSNGIPPKSLIVLERGGEEIMMHDSLPT
jgi:hypothetical protein